MKNDRDRKFYKQHTIFRRPKDFCPDRRQFLRYCGLLGETALTASLFNPLDGFGNTEKPLHFVIVGAGLAGLCAAYELEKRGHTCIVLEAEPTHIGGRVRTLRFEDNLYGEAGAMRIPLCHNLTRHYIDEFALETRRFIHANPNAYYCLRGHRERIKNVKNLYPLYALKTSEKSKTLNALWNEALTGQFKGLSNREKADLHSDDLETCAVRRIDHRSLRQTFQQAGISAEAIELIGATFAVQSLLSSATSEFLREELDGVGVEGYLEIVGGTDRLPMAFAQCLRSKPRLGCEVVRLEQNSADRTATAVYKEQGKYYRVTGDFVLCTLPFPVLKRIPVTPPFTFEKQRAIEALHYESSTKILAITRSRFWEREDRIFGGASYTDLPTAMTFYPSDNITQNPHVSDRPAVLLASYTWGEQARYLGRMPHAQRAGATIEILQQIHPQLGKPGMLRHTASWNWDTHQWNQGAFAWFMPGQHTGLHRHVMASEGRIFFAGEHCSLAHSWMQGALESALRAIREMIEVSRLTR